MRKLLHISGINLAAGIVGLVAGQWREVKVRAEASSSSPILKTPVMVDVCASTCCQVRFTGYTCCPP